MNIARVSSWIGPSLLLAWASVASAQVQVQGQVIIQPMPTEPTVVPAPPPPVVITAPPQAYSTPQTYTQPQAPVVMQASCPSGTSPSMTPDGRTLCLEPVTRHRVRGGLLGGGIGMLAGGWVLSMVSSLVTGLAGAFHTDEYYTSGDLETYFDWGFVPVLGPWVQMGFTPPFADNGFYAWLAFEGLLQAGGLVMIIFGAIGEEYTDYRPIAGVDLSLRPLMSMNTQGLEATWRF